MSVKFSRLYVGCLVLGCLGKAEAGSCDKIDDSVFFGILGVLVVVVSAFSVSAMYFRFKLNRIVSDPRNKIVPTAVEGPTPQGGQNDKITPKKANLLKAKKQSYPWEVNFKDIKLVDEIGEGNFGEVYVGVWCDIKVAIKIPHKDIPGDILDKFFDEIGIMTKLHHPNIVMFLGACITPPNICLLMEFLERGNLFDFLNDRGNEISHHQVLKFAMDIARGMKYLHRRCGIIQRDLKSRNLLLDESLNAKVCDFGLSRYHAKETTTMTHCGTPYWTAPEVIRQETYDESADVYSFSIVLWELVAREEPYNGMPAMEAAYACAQHGLRPQIPDGTPDEFSSIMVTCWQDDPKKRPSFDTVLEKLYELRKGKRFLSQHQKQLQQRQQQDREAREREAAEKAAAEQGNEKGSEAPPSDIDTSMV